MVKSPVHGKRYWTIACSVEAMGTGSEHELREPWQGELRISHAPSATDTENVLYLYRDIKVNNPLFHAQVYEKDIYETEREAWEAFLERIQQIRENLKIELLELDDLERQAKEKIK